MWHQPQTSTGTNTQRHKHAEWTHRLIATNFSTSLLKPHWQISPTVPKTWPIKVLCSTRTFMKTMRLYMSSPDLRLPVIYFREWWSHNNCFLCVRPWLEGLSWDQMSFPHCAHKKITLWSGSEHCLQSWWLFAAQCGLSVPKSLCFKGSREGRNPSPAAAPCAWPYGWSPPGSHSWWFIYCFLSYRSLIQDWCCFWGCHVSYLPAQGPWWSDSSNCLFPCR